MVNKMQRVLVIAIAAALILFIASGPCLAKEESKKSKDFKILVGSWSENDTDKAKKGDFTFIYYIASYKKIHLRYDQYTGQTSPFRRYWLHYGAIPIVNTSDVKIGISPGVAMLRSTLDSNFQQNFYGGIATLDLPKLKLNFEQRSYAGDKRALQYTFANYKLHKNFLVSFTQWSYGQDVMRGYLGPKANFDLGKDGNVSAFYGFSTIKQRPDARLLMLSGSMKF